MTVRIYVYTKGNIKYPKGGYLFKPPIVKSARSECDDKR